MENKIIFLASCPHSLINFRLHLMQEFLNRRYSVIAMAPYNESISHQLEKIGIQFIPIPMERNGINPIKDIINFFKLKNAIQKVKAQIIFTYTIKPVIYGTLAAKLAGVKYTYAMITGIGYAFSNQNKKANIIGFIAKKLLQFTLKFNNKIFFQNRDNAELFVKTKLISDWEKIVIVNGSGVDLNFFELKPLPKQFSFIMITRLLYDKGVREYIEAAKIIKQQYPQIDFKIAGWIDTNPNAISEKELSHWIETGIITYLGKLADVREAITNASVYILPSYSEGTPRTVLEAMSMGRPIITTNVPGCKETVVDGKNGFLVPPKDVKALCTAITYFIDNPQNIEKMGMHSRELATDKYDVHKVNQSILQKMEIIPNTF